MKQVTVATHRQEEGINRGMNEAGIIESHYRIFTYESKQKKGLLMIKYKDVTFSNKIIVSKI